MTRKATQKTSAVSAAGKRWLTTNVQKPPVRTLSASSNRP